MDVFIPEDYVRKRRLEKKLKSTVVASTKSSQTHSRNVKQRRRDSTMVLTKVAVKRFSCIADKMNIEQQPATKKDSKLFP
ncbi:hypothetical protein RYX36_003208 [Vicia faba]